MVLYVVPSNILNPGAIHYSKDSVKAIFDVIETPCFQTFSFGSCTSAHFGQWATMPLHFRNASAASDQKQIGWPVNKVRGASSCLIAGRHLQSRIEPIHSCKHDPYNAADTENIKICIIWTYSTPLFQSFEQLNTYVYIIRVTRSIYRYYNNGPLTNRMQVLKLLCQVFLTCWPIYN